MSNAQETESSDINLGWLKTYYNIYKSNSTNLFGILSVILLIMEPILNLFDIDRLWFYVILIPLYFHVITLYTSRRGVHAKELTIFGKTFPTDDSKLKQNLLITSILAYILITLLYLDEIIFVVAGSEVEISLHLLNFQQYFLMFLILMTLHLKVLGYERGDGEDKFGDSRTKKLIAVNSTLLFLLPAFLIKDKLYYLTIVNMFGVLEWNDYYLKLGSDVNFIQHQLFISFTMVFFILTFKDEIFDFLTSGNRRVLWATLISSSFLLYDAVAISLSANTSKNMFQQIEIIIFQAATLIMISAGLTLTTRVRKFGNFAHAEFVTVGLYVVIMIREFQWMEDLVTLGFNAGGIEVSLFFGNNIFGLMFFAFIITGFVGILSELLVFAPLDRRSAVPLTLMVGSIGLGLVLRQVIQEIFGGNNQGAVNPTYPRWFRHVDNIFEDFPIIELMTIGGIIIGIYIATNYSNKSDKFLAISLSSIIAFSLAHLIGLMFIDIDEERVSRIDMGVLNFGFFTIELFETSRFVVVSPDHAWALFSMVATVLGLRYIFTKTTLGISMRATADDEDLAQISGINTRRVIYWTWFIAAGVTGVGALYRFEASNIIPASGFTVLLIIFAVVILGGFDSFEGTLISAFIVAIVQMMGILINDELGQWEQANSEIDTLVFWTARSDWSQVIPFAIIIVVLLVRPRGIFGVVDPKSKL